MARLDIPVVSSVDTGVDLQTPAQAASALGHQFADNGRRLLYVRNTDASSHVVNVLVSSKVEGLTVGPQVITVPAGTHRVAGLLTGDYRQSDGNIYVDVPVLTGMTLAVLDVA